MPPEPDRDAPSAEIPPLEQIRHVHLVAIAGTGMGSLACMLADQGFRVTGSDLDTYPPMSDQLERAGIAVQKGFAAEHALQERPDLAVIGNAVRRDNPEARALIDAGVPYVSFPDAVHHFFLRGKHSIVVAGTHGKTTTTSLVGWILAHAGRDPSVLVGGVVQNFGGSFRLGTGEHFVIEGDEYDTAFFDKTPKFLHYAPQSLLFTSCEFDHADIYASLDDVKDAFRELIRSVPSDGRIVAATDDLEVRAITKEASAPVEGYGFQEGALWRPSDVTFDRSGTQFNVWCGEERMARLRMPLFGRHNVENALGATAICSGIGIEEEAIADALAAYEGVRRRQELRGEEGGVLVFEDFAHHPTAVRETLAAFRARYPDHKLWAVFEPRTNTSRRRFFEDAYADALAVADRAIIAGVYRAGDIPEDERLRPERVVEEIRDREVDAWTFEGVDEIIELIARRRTGRDAVVIMSNGAFGGIWDRLLARLRSAAPASA